jgi:glycerol-3-phosphate cytidylyltransferase-like family protein
VIPFEERIEVVRACRYVDLAVPQESMDKLDAWQRYKFNVMFVGDDWYRSDKWRELDAAFGEREVRILYFPYTRTTSSTLINQTLQRLRTEGTSAVEPAELLVAAAGHPQALNA